MPSFFDLQKFAHTGIASADMTAFDKARALAAFGGGKTQTLTDVPPLSFKANGKPLISWSMLGNGSQTGTPSPQSIIMPTFCGVRTANLFDGVIEQGTISAEGTLRDVSNRVRTKNFTDLAAGTYTIQSSNNIGEISVFIFTYTVDGTFIARIPSEWIALPYSFALSERAKVKIIFEYTQGYVINPSDVKNIMLNSGPTALPYEPFGWAEKITNAGQTVPVYLGQTQTVRRVRKLVLDGTEAWYDSAAGIHRITLPGYLRENINVPFCTHYVGISPVSEAGSIGELRIAFLISASGNNYMYIRDSTYSTATAFQSYLSAQYAAGTPVTVWYVLKTPESAIFNEPIAKIGDYADELHSEDAGVTIPTAKGQNTLTVDTELQPSSMTITYKK